MLVTRHDKRAVNLLYKPISKYSTDCSLSHLLGSELREGVLMRVCGYTFKLQSARNGAELSHTLFFPC